MKIHLLLLSLSLGQLAADGCFQESVRIRGTQIGSTLEKDCTGDCYEECKATEDCLAMMYNTAALTCALYSKVNAQVDVTSTVIVSAVMTDCATTQAPDLSHMNVLFLVADDMRTDLGCYEDSNTGFSSPTMSTPNLDALAAKSLLLENAYVQQAICGPSRASVMTGRRPDTTHVLNLNPDFRDVGGDFTTIPQYFKDAGYKSIGVGKIFHEGHEDNDYSWSEDMHSETNYYRSGGNSWQALTDQEMEDEPERTTAEADYAICQLEELAPDALSGDQPFFLAYGARKPHLPWVFPEAYLDLYPLEDIIVPENHYAPIDMPETAWYGLTELISGYTDSEFTENDDLGNVNATLGDDKVKELRRAYYAAISYTDYELGRIIDKLDELGLAENTVIVFWGDHGWQLGEHAEWCKNTNFEVAARAPLMVHIPGVTDAGIKTAKLVEFVDIFPTIVEAAGFDPLDTCPTNSNETSLCTEGSSLLPLMDDPLTSDWKEAVFWQYPRGGWKEDNTNIPECMGYSMRTDQYHYTEWVQITFLGDNSYEPDWETVCDSNEEFQSELYDLSTDPEENVNIVGDDDQADIVAELSTRLRAGWRDEIE